ncbi:MAG: hypothetical protein IT449_06140 [Phycisphaerales bacterium]|nr:hypothetical protein [Phycisphaerales bacterium]
MQQADDRGDNGMGNVAGEFHDGAADERVDGSTPAAARNRTSDNGHPGKPPRTGRVILRFFSSVWLGIGLLVLLFIYSSIGSAMPFVRQHRWLEMTEFEWFHWWPFDVLVALICANITVVTLRRIPFRPVNYGVWMIHAGILILAGGSVYYFGTKIEGDAQVLRRHVRIVVPGADEPAGLVVLPGNETTMQTPQGAWTFSIQETNSEYRLMTGDDKGKRAHAVMVAVQPPQGESFVRQLLTGYPQFTEDVLPGKGRAIKAIGKPLVDETLQLSLEYEPQEWFHVINSWALYVREEGAKEWTQAPLRHMPRYNACVPARDDVLSDTPVELRPLDLPVEFPKDQVNLGDATFHISGYLPYAEMRRNWLEGGSRLNPYLRVNIIEGDASPRSIEMLALDANSRRALDGAVEFRLLSDESEIDQLPRTSMPALTIRVPATRFERRLELTQDRVVGNDGPWTELEGAGLSYRVSQVMEDLEVAPGRTASLVWLDLKTPEKEWTRVVMDDAAGSFDMPGLGFDPHAAGAARERGTDPAIETEFSPSSARLIFSALPDGRLHVVWNGSDSSAFRRFAKVGEALPLAPHIRVVATSLLLNAVSEVKPYIVPPQRREKEMMSQFLLSMIRLDMTSGGRTRSEWIPFSTYAALDENYGYRGRYPFRPLRLMLADGRRIEVLFSRERHRLPAPVALEDFELLAQLGGYTGESLTVRNWRSDLRFWSDAGWTGSQPVSVNSPSENRGYWYYQAAWDPPPQNASGGGMNYTVLGVGNRNGVNIMLAGCCLSVIGMIYAFYFKPRIIRRRKEQAALKLGRGRHDGAELDPAADRMALGVG